jgi:hypothetical protein
MMESAGEEIVVEERDIRSIVEKAIDLYNRLRSPEAVAKLMSIEDGIVKIMFKGSFSFTCGIRDWVEDMVYVFEDLGVEAELLKYLEPDDPNMDIRVGVFHIKRIRGERNSGVGGSR